MNLRERWDKLEPRERRLLGVLLGIVAAIAVLALPIWIVSTVSAKREANATIRDLIGQIDAARATIAERRAKHDALVARYAKPAPQLAGFIEETAKANGLALPESQDRPEVPHGKRFSERITVVKLHKIGLLALAKTLEKIEQSGFPVAVTRLNIKPRQGEQDAYEVELGVSAFDRKGDAAPAPAGSAAPATSSSAEEVSP